MNLRCRQIPRTRAAGEHRRCIPAWTVALVLVLVFAPAVTHAEITGFVVDKTAGVPVVGARVSVQTTGLFVFTQGDGSFRLPAEGFVLTITAAHVGYFTGSTRAATPTSNVRIELEAVPLEDNPDYVFKAPTTCSLCHIVQFEQWSGSPMAEAGQNSWTYDVYDGSGTASGSNGFVYTRDSAHAGVNPSSECASCHQPERWIAEPFVALEDNQSLSRESIHGVSCEVCHKIAHIDETQKNTPGIFPGVVAVNRPQAGSNAILYGVLGDVDYHASTMRASYQPQLVAAVCAACHQDKNDPDDDGIFEEDNGITSEPTYNEWRATPYGDEQSPLYRTCVDCHMPAYGDSLVCRILWQFRPSDRIRSHRIEGTTPQYLEHAVSLTVDVDEATPGNLQVDVSIYNNTTGHHVPTGVSIRNMILLVQAWDLQSGAALESTGNQTVHDLGGIGDPEQGYYAGLPGKLYGKITAGPTGDSPVFFTEAVRVVSDTRIAALETDTTTYSFRRPADSTVQVRARLIYRRAWRAMVDRKSWTETGHGEPLADLQEPHFGHLMEEARWSSAAVYVESFSAENVESGVQLHWDVVASIRDLQGFRLYRSVAGAAAERVHAEDMLPFTQRQYVDEELPAGQRVSYILKLVLAEGSEVEPPPVEVFTPSPHAALEQNFPNPFNPRTSIAYVVPRSGASVRLSIHDMRGRLVRVLVNTHEEGGRHVVSWDGTDDRGVAVASGVYALQLRAGNETFNRQMSLVK